MGYNYITDYDAHSFTKGRQGADIQYIVIHHWGTQNATGMNIVNYFRNPNCPTSAHYVLDGKDVYCVVNEYDTAYHAGDWWYNIHSIGIECRTECRAVDIETLAELIADLWKRYGKLKVVGHKDIVATACPGLYYDKIPYIIKRAEEIFDGEPTEIKIDKVYGYETVAPSTQPVSVKGLDDIAREVMAGNWGNGSDRKERLTNAGYDARAVQVRVNQFCGVSEYGPSASVDLIAQAVMRGDYGNGAERRQALINAGYDADAVQQRVNELLS